MSRQRLRTGVLEATTRACPHCDGTGLVRTASSAGLAALRLIEDEAAKGKGVVITLFASTEAAVYLLNAKRADLADIEARYGVSAEVIPEGENEGAKMRVISSGPRNEFVPRFEPIAAEVEDEEVFEEDEDEIEREEVREQADDDGNGGTRRRRRKRRRGRHRNRAEELDADVSPTDEHDEDEDAEEPEIQEHADADREAAEAEGSDAPRKRRRRGGRRRRGRRGENGAEDLEGVIDDEAMAEIAEPIAEEQAPVAGAAPVIDVEAPKPKRTRRKKAVAEDESGGPAAVAPAEAEEATEAKPRRGRRKKIDEAEPAATVVVEAKETEPKPKRTRRKKAETAEPEAIAQPAPVVEEAPAKPKRGRRKKVEDTEASAAPVSDASMDLPAAGSPDAANDANGSSEAETDDGEPTRRGWWQRTFGA